MAQVATSTSADPLAPPSAGVVTRDTATGNLYCLVQTATNTLTLHISTNGGTSWSALVQGAFTHTGLAEWSTFVYDNNIGHLAYRVSTTGAGGTDTIWYRRWLPDGSGWSAGLQTSSNDSNGGTAGATWQGVDLATVRNSNGSHAIVIAGARTQGTTRYGVQVMGVSITAPDYSGASTGSGGRTIIYANNPIIQGTRAWWASGTAPGRSGVAVEVEHNGNGQTASTPNVWINWGRARNEMVKLSWLGQQQGWQGPASSVVIRSSVPTAMDQPAARWDGTQFVTAVVSPDSTSVVRLYQRNRANTQTTTYDTPTHPQGAIRNIALSYDQTTKNPRVYAIGTTNAQIYWVDYTRATSTWGSWNNLVATAVLGPTEWGTRRGGTSGSNRHDLAYAVSGSPNTIQHIQQVAVNTLPSTATWNYAVTPPNGAAADINAGLTLAWNFYDPDVSQTQGAYALRRQIGTGTAAWWNAGTSTWVASETFNTTTTQQVTIPSGWGADADPLHNFAVRVQDSASGSAQFYSDVTSIIPSVKSNPIISTPTAAQVLTTDTVNVSWAVTEQTGYRVTLTDTTGGGSVLVYDSGPVKPSIGSSVVVPYSMPNGTAYTAAVTTYNNEGLASTVQTRNFTVSYATPPPVVPTLTAVPASGWMTVTSTALAPAGTQPAIVSQDLYRRVKPGAATLINNGDFNGSTSGFFGQGGTLSYSTAQFRSAPGSARLVPTGAAADSQVVSSTTVILSAAVVAGTTPMTVGGWIRPDTANKPIRVQINWLDASNAFLSQTGLTVTSVIAGAWQYVEFTGTAPAGAARAAAVLGLTSTPAGTDGFNGDDMFLREGSTSSGTRAAQLLGVGATYNDWGAPGSADLEYRWVTKGANGAIGVGPWAG